VISTRGGGGWVRIQNLVPSCEFPAGTHGGPGALPSDDREVYGESVSARYCNDVKWAQGTFLESFGGKSVNVSCPHNYLLTNV